MLFPWNLLPFNQNTQKKFMNMKPDEIEKYVQQMMGKMMNSNMKGMMKPEEWLKEMEEKTSNPIPSASGLHPEIFETHDFVFLRLGLKEDGWTKQMKLFYTSTQVIIEHIPEFSDKHSFTLPAAVKRKGAQASLRDGVLELRLPKSSDVSYSEIELS